MGTQCDHMSHKHLSLWVSYLINESLQPFQLSSHQAPKQHVSNSVLWGLPGGDTFSQLFLYSKVFVFQA